MTQPLRVLIVEPASQSGNWDYTVSLGRALARRAVVVRLATLFPYERFEEIEEVPVSIIGRILQTSAERSWHPHRRVLDHVEKIRGLIRVVQDFQPNIVHFHGSLGRFDFAYYGLIKRLGARVVYTAHDVSPSPWLDAFNRMRYRAADLTVVHSAVGVADLMKNYGIGESRIVQIPHVSLVHLAGNGALSREEAKAFLGLPANARAVLFFGRIAPHKGLDLLIDAFAILGREHSYFYLIIAGEPSGDFASYRERIAEAGLSAHVILDLRYVPFDLIRVYFSAADVVVLPYRGTYHSGVLQSAYAFGRPVVATNVGGIGEAVTADGTGVVVDVLNGDAIARAILSLLTDSKLAREMGDRGLLLARTKYSGEAVSERLEAIYRGLHSRFVSNVRVYEHARRD